ncbi:hypothetical protein CY35_05G013200 [Sphagnum magellanicum]|nr:hypothetical protein CY35_05G013200 [Sphagnum magellanicum]
MLPGIIVLSLLLLPALGSVYQIGDSVPLARMEQFHGQRTSWLHQRGRHSPHFGVDTEAPSSLVSGNCKVYRLLLN